MAVSLITVKREDLHGKTHTDCVRRDTSFEIKTRVYFHADTMIRSDLYIRLRLCRKLWLQGQISLGSCEKVYGERI